MSNKHTQSGQTDSTNSDKRIIPTQFVPHTGTDETRVRRSKAPSLIIAAALIGVAGIALFLFRAGLVEIQTEPPDSNTSIAGILMLKLGNRYLLLPGEYDLNITAPGYYDLNETLTVDKTGSQTLSRSLIKLPGRLQVDTQPRQGATVLIDDVARGTTPVLINDLQPGPRQVEIVLHRYQTHRQEITIEGMDQEQSLSVQLLPAWAEVTFASIPSAAEVYVDDKLIGQTPLSAELIQGKREISIRLSGYQQWRQTVTIKADEPQAFEHIELQAAAATVVLNSRPAGASVTIDGDYKGLTPLEFAVTPDKTAQIRLFKQGYKPASRSVKPTSGEQQTFTINLTAELVEVAFSVVPADAQLYVNGILQTAANTTLQLPTRSHKIELRRDGYVTVKRNVTPHTGVDQQIRIRMKSEQQLKRESVKSLIKTHAGQTLKLLKPGTFTAGASRREPGRRANETLQKIRLNRNFYLGLHEVTNAQFKKFKPRHSAGTIQGHSLDPDPHPATRVTWQDAAKYCNWLSDKDSLAPFYKEENGRITGINPAAEGYRLPTEAEWAWAARAQRGLMLKFPWGPKLPPKAQSGNFADTSAANIIGKILNEYTDGFSTTAPVGSFAANGKGLFDMGGNVAEWVNDFYDVAPGQKQVLVNPLGPDSGEFHVIRGSSWAHGTVTELRLSYRDYGNEPRNDVGFRIARFAE
ncbi:MAG: PEGA domain-containing protein [Gammaproteobacteria bacterium]